MNSVQLRKEAPKRETSKCIFCCKSGPRGNDKKLSSTPDGQSNVITSPEKLKDNLLHGLTKEEINDIKYHTRSCYGPYVLRGSRVPTEAVVVQVAESPEQQADTPVLPTREARSVTSPVTNEDPSKKIFVICNHIKHKNITVKFRISENSRARSFLAAYKFNKDDVHRRCIFLKTVGDIFAADIYCHDSCTKNYIRKYLDELMKLKSAVADIEAELYNEAEIQQAINDHCNSLKLNSQAYELSKCREEINTKLNDSGLEITNRVLKSHLITRFGNQICFTYPSDASLSQMFFSSNIKATDIAETVRTTDEVSVCANLLRDECKGYDFSLQNSYRDADDLSISYNTFKENRPVVWDKFFKSLLEQAPLSLEKQRVCDTIFQIAYSLIHNDTTITPLTVELAQAIHDTCRSKKLVTICKRLGLVTSYDSVQRTDTSLAQCMIDQTGQNRVPVPPAIQSNNVILIHIVFDNYFHNSVKSGERRIRANKSPAVKTSINRLDQPLPPVSEIPKFWACDENKIRLQQFFISWIEKSYDGQKPLYLGGCHSNGGEYECVRIQDQIKEKIELLYCTHEEADDRITFHVNHAIFSEGFRTVLVCSGDTDVYVSLLYNFKSWQQYGLQQLWILHNEEVSHVHESIAKLPQTVVNILPALHALSGCDTTSKVGTKKKAFMAAKTEKNQKSCCILDLAF